MWARTAQVALTVWVLGGVPPQAPTAPSSPQTFTARADLVTINVSVRTPNGQPVTDLSAQDFEVFDAGERTPLEDFRGTPAPVTVAVLFDVSGSMDVGKNLVRGRATVRQLLGWLTPDRDRVALFAFDTRLEQLQPFTFVPADVEARLDGLRPFGQTSLYDATSETARVLARQGGDHQAVVVVTDGADTSSRSTPDQVAAVARAIEVPVYIIEVVSPLDHPGRDTAVTFGAAAVPHDPLRDLSSVTGGAWFAVSTPADQSATAQQIVTDLRQQYQLAFAMSTRAGWHALDVRVHRKNVVVRARRGYQAGGHAW
jgi:VWFA-related protein